MTWFLLPFVDFTYAAIAFTVIGSIFTLLSGIIVVISSIRGKQFKRSFETFKNSIVFTLVFGIISTIAFGAIVGIKYLVG